MKSALFWDITQSTELLCHVKSQKSADLAVAFLCLFAFHLYLLLTFLTIGALLLVHLMSLSFLSRLTTVMYVTSNTWIWSLLFCACFPHLPSTCSNQINLYPFFCAFYSIPILLCISHLPPCVL
jgi:hypothetical protein